MQGLVDHTICMERHSSHPITENDVNRQREIDRSMHTNLHRQIDG